MPPDFRGKIALVTGVGRVGQIGHAVARGLAEAGAQLVIADVNAAGLAERAKELTAAGHEVRVAAGDLATPDAARRAVRVAREQLGGLDVLVNVGPPFDPGKSSVVPAATVKVPPLTPLFANQASLPCLRSNAPSLFTAT